MTNKVCEKSHQWDFNGSGKDCIEKQKARSKIEQIRQKKQQWKLVK